ncbi:MAG: UDP-N-acetylmuramate--L-alanine ligase [Patescibacteria group bacterium]
MNIHEVKKIYISGIGGIGISALARYFFVRGVEVVGSDLVHSEVTDDLEKLGIKINFAQTAENITFAYDLFLYSSAVPITNPERIKAKEWQIPQKSYFEVLGELSREYKTVAISGTNGKSTTMAMIGAIMIDAEKDPTVIIGSRFGKINGNFRNGTSDLLIAEACEYRAHMLLLKPQTIVLTNIEEDHLDYYKDLNHIVQTFQQYVNGLKGTDNWLIYNNDDLNIRKLNLPKCRLVRYGFIPGAEVFAVNIRKSPGKQLFDVIYYGQNLGEFELNIPGDFNIYNALAAIAYTISFDIPVGIIKESLKKYRGIWRRFEIVKNDEDLTVISDYAHHPTAVAGTLKAIKEFLPGRRIVAVFQPHQKDRTRKLFDDFIHCFGDADVLILNEIYDVAGREEESNKISSDDLAKAIKAIAPNKEIYFTKDFYETENKIKEVLKKEDVVVVMGAGDIYHIVNKIGL